MLAAHQRSLVASSPIVWRPIKTLRGRADVYRIIYDGGPGMHPHHETRRKLADLSLASSRIPCLYVCGPSSMHCTRGRLNWIIGRGDPPLPHFVCRNGPHVLRLGWRLGCERRHRPNPSKSHPHPSGGAVVTRRTMALVLSTHTLRVAELKPGDDCWWRHV